MIVKETVIQKPNHLGGKGTIEIHAAMQGEENFRGHGRMLAMVTLPPGSSIGYHQHVGETETPNRFNSYLSSGTLYSSPLYTMVYASLP